MFAHLADSLIGPYLNRIEQRFLNPQLWASVLPSHDAERT